MPPERVFVVRSGPSLERLRILPPQPSLKRGRAYLVGAVVLGLGFIGVAVASAVRRTLPAARALFLASVVYLLALCTLLLLDRV